MGFHALLYTRRDLILFGPAARRRSAGDYLKRTCALCGELGGRVLVFGSPGSRARGGLPLEQATEIATGFFRDVADAAAASGVYVLIEPLTPEETDFVDSTADGLRLVERVDHPHFRLHLDAKAWLADGAPALGPALPVLEHVHASAPDLGPPGEVGADHAPLGAALRSGGYDQYVSLEMRRGDGPAEAQIERGVAYLRRAYLGA